MKRPNGKILTVPILTILISFIGGYCGSAMVLGWPLAESNTIFTLMLTVVYGSILSIPIFLLCWMMQEKSIWFLVLILSQPLVFFIVYYLECAHSHI